MRHKLDTANPETKRALNRLGWLAAIGMAVLFGVILAHDSASSPKPAVAQPPALTVAATQLFSDYRKNEVAADVKYKGKTLAVTGIVESITKDITDDMFVEMQSGAGPYSATHVNAHLKDSEVQHAAALSIGDSVTVRCTGSGMVLGSPLLEDCVIP